MLCSVPGLCLLCMYIAECITVGLDVLAYQFKVLIHTTVIHKMWFYFVASAIRTTDTVIAQICEHTVVVKCGQMGQQLIIVLHQ